MSYTQTDRALDDTEASPTPAGGTEAFLRGVVKRFARAEAAEAINRKNALDDLLFRSGEQWPEDIKASRTIDKRPCLTINKVNTFVHQITNEQRQNRPAINISPIGDKGDPETAKMLKGLIRQIERLSHADIAYDTGFESAVSIGWGFWRVTTEYESEKTFNQVLKLERIRNAMRVYIDPDHQMPTGQDMEWAFITDLVPRAEFKETWPDADTVEWQEGSIGDENKWCTQTHVRIAEYFYYDTEMRSLLALASGHIGWEDELAPEIAAQIKANPKIVLKRREVPVKRVKWCKLTCKEILEENDWPGKWIPIVKCTGNEYDIEGELSLQGLVRAMKDPQRMYNFWCTSETELIALAPKAPWIMEEGQVEGYENRWREANTKSLPYLLYRATSVSGKPAPPPQRQQFAAPPAGVLQAKIGAAQDMQAVTGVRWDATMQERMNDESGKALRELKRVGDIGNFHYVDNLARSLKFTGEILIDLIPKIYDTRRVLMILREDDSEEQVTIDPNLPQAHQQQTEGDNVKLLYNPGVGEYAVAVTIGPSFSTKRQEASDSMLQFMAAIPNSAPLIADLVAKNQDWPGAEEIYARLQATLPPGVLDPKTRNLPPEAKGLIANLTQQVQQLTQQRDQAAALLGDKDKDRQVDLEKINKDYEAKMTDIATGFREEVMKLQAVSGNGSAEMAKMQIEYQAKLDKLAAEAQIEREKMVAQMQIERERMQAESEMQAQKLMLENMARHREIDGKQREMEGKLKLQEDANKIKAESAKTEEPAKPKKRSGKITGPSGRIYQLEVSEH